MNAKFIQIALRIFTMVVSIIFIIYAQLNVNLSYAYLAVFILFIHNIIYALDDLYNKIVYFLFHVTFYIFLLSRIFIRFLDGDIYAPFSNEINIYMALSLYISLFFVFLGISFLILIRRPYSKNLETNIIQKNIISGEYIYKLRLVSKILMYISFTAMLLRKLEVVFLMQSTSYSEWRLTYATSLPILVIRISNIYLLCLCVYLATLPQKKKCMVPLLCYILVGIFSMFYGIRGDFVLNILFVIIYLVIRNKVEPGNKSWFTKREIIFCILALPLMIMLLYTIGITRLGKNVEYLGFCNTVKDFFDQQGISINIIGYVKKYHNSFPTGHFYMFGGILDFLKHNALSTWILNIPNYAEHTIGRALYGDSLGQTLTYIVYPDNYISGIGMGSSYIAEAYHDFGYIGVALINLFYGILMGEIIINKKRNVWLLAIKLLMIEGLLYAPRSAADGFITQIISIPNFFGIIIIWFTCKLLSNQYSYKLLPDHQYTINNQSGR